MKISTKGRYGLRAILDVALHQQEGPVTIRSISERQDLSERYLEQLLNTLRQNSLINSIRGFQGGYILNREPEKITVGDVVRALEGPISPVDCVGDDAHSLCSRADKCVTQIVWEDLRKAMVGVLDSYTLADLTEKYYSMKCNSFDNYMI